MSNSPLHPDIVNNIFEILSYLGAAFAGWVAKWLQRKKNKEQ